MMKKVVLRCTSHHDTGASSWKVVESRTNVPLPRYDGSDE